MAAEQGLAASELSTREVSVIIAAFNAEETLAAAVDSVLVQRGLTWELVIVDDGSSDDSLAVARSLAEGRPGVSVYSQSNAGTGAAINHGLRVSRAPWILRLDADDELEDRYLETMRGFMDENPGFDIYSCDLMGMREQEAVGRVFGWTEPRSFTLEDMLGQCFIPGAGTMVRRELVEQAGGYREGIYNEDYDLWLRLMAAGARHIYCPEALYRYRQGDASQKSADVMAAYASDVTIIEHLMASSRLSAGAQDTARRAIEQRRGLMRDLMAAGKARQDAEILADLAEREARALRTAVARVIPKRHVERAIGVVRRVGRVAQPLRAALRNRRARTASRATPPPEVAAEPGNGGERSSG